MVGKNVQAYVDDMVVTSQARGQHMSDLEEPFATITKYRLKLNLEKCVFGVEAGKFLGFLLTERGIEAKPGEVCGNPCHEKFDLGEGDAAVDRANGRPVQICVNWRGKMTPLFPVFEKE